MAAAEPEVVHTGNTPEKIAEYKIIYDYSRVGHHFQKEAEMWFGYHTRPHFSNTSVYHCWRKWNDPRVGSGKGKSYMVQLGKCPILVKATGELAISPTVLKQRFYKKEEKKVEEMFEGFRKVFADEMKPVVEVEAEVDVEAGVDVEGPTAAMEQMKLKDEGMTLGDILGVETRSYAPNAKLIAVAKYGDKVVVAEEGELEKAMEMAAKILEKRDKQKKS